MSTAAPRLQLHDARLLINSVATSALTGSTLKAGGFYLAPKTGNIRWIGICTSATISSPTYDLRIETMTAGSVNPSGTLFGTNTNVTTTLVAGANTFTWYQLTADAAVTAGNAFGVVVGYSSGTIDASHAATLVVGTTSISQEQPYHGTYNGSAWSMATGMPSICVKYDDGTIVQEGLPLSQHQSGASYSSGSSPNERALVFTPPVDCELTGLRAIGVLNDISISTLSINVYLGTSTTPLATYTPSRPMATSAGFGLPMAWSFPAVALTGGQTYRISIKATGAGGISFYRLTFPSTAERDASFGPGYQSTRGGGSWTDSTTNVDLMVPVFNTVTIPMRAIAGFAGGMD